MDQTEVQDYGGVPRFSSEKGAVLVYFRRAFKIAVFFWIPAVPAVVTAYLIAGRSVFGQVGTVFMMPLLIFTLVPFSMLGSTLAVKRNEISELTERARQLAERMSKTALPVFELEGKSSPKHCYALRTHDAILLSKRLADQFTPGMIDFVLAHELAHEVVPKKLTTWQNAYLAALLFAIAYACFVGVLVLPGVIQDTKSMVAFGVGTVAMVAILTVWRSKRTFRREFECDRAAVLATRDPESARAFAKALYDLHPKKGPSWWYNHPGPQERELNIEEAIRDLPPSETISSLHV